MNKFRTNKKIKTDLHNDNEYIVEFRYTYKRDWKAEGIYVNTDAFDVIPSTGIASGPPDIDGDFVNEPIETEILRPIPGSASRRFIPNDQIDQLCAAVTPITPELSDDSLNCIQHVDATVRNGIKVLIAQEQLWKGQLSVSDFE
jgi:hypothetical protein